MAVDGSRLPYELWQGLAASEFEELIARLEIPPRSWALQELWHRLMTSEAPTAVPGASGRFLAARIEALERSGLIDEAIAALARAPDGDPVFVALHARSEIGLGNRERGCELVRALSAAVGALPAHLKGEAALMAGYCAAAAGDTTAATLAASLARELGLGGAGPDALDAIVSGTGPVSAHTGRVTPVIYRILELGGRVEPQSLIATATPALLAVLALSPQSSPLLKLPAGEAAARAGTLSSDALAALYRSAAADGGGPAQERAALFRAVEGEPSPSRKARLIYEFVENERRGDFSWLALAMMGKLVRDLVPAAEIGWFAETAIEVSLAAQDFDRARTWAAYEPYVGQSSQGRRLEHWQALADIADPHLATARSAHFGALEQMAADGQLSPALAYRLATVLDALAIRVPLPLWDLAGRTPQPEGGHLPDTGALAQLAEASAKQESGRTVLLAMLALGPNGPEGAHIIALRDAIRALRRAGLQADAHRLAFEALFSSWPRGGQAAPGMKGANAGLAQRP